MSLIHLYFSGCISVWEMSDENNRSKSNIACDIYTVPFILKSLDWILKKPKEGFPSSDTMYMCVVAPSVLQIIQHNIIPFFLPLQASPHIFWHRPLFRGCQSVFISKQKKYLQYHSKGVQGMTLPLPALCNASGIGRFRRYKDYNWAHLPVSLLRFIQDAPVQAGYSLLSGDPSSDKRTGYLPRVHGLC